MSVYLRLLFTLYCGIINGTMTNCLWTDVPHFFTVYLENRTWNDAREHCRSTGSQLLSIISHTEWKFWKHILNLDDHRSVTGTYWMGLHAPDPHNPNLYFWDNCTLPEYTEPTVYDYLSRYYQCAVMWLKKEFVVGEYLDVWLKDVICNETHPFICMANVNETNCVDFCDELVVLTDQKTCEALCVNSACQAMYSSQLQMCHMIPNMYNKQSRLTICYLPSVDYTPNICSSGSEEAVIQASDNNMNVSDKLCMEQHYGVNYADNTLGEKGCICLCEKLWTFLATPAPEVVNLTIEEKAEIIVKELTIEKKNTTINLRKYVSVMDYRPTSVGIGIVAGTIILFVLAIVVIIDLSSTWHVIEPFLLKMLYYLKPPVNRRAPFTQANATESVDSFELENPSKCAHTALSQISGVGWFLRERSVYRQIAPNDTRIHLASELSKNKRMIQSSQSTSEV